MLNVRCQLSNVLTMFIFTFYRIIKFAIQGFWRNIWLSLITISMMILALISMNFLFVLNVMAKSAVKLVQERIDMSVYFKDDTDESIIKEVKNKLLTLAEVERVEYTSKDEALEEFRKKHKSDRLILEALEETGGNPLVGTLKIKSKNISDYQVILDFIDNSKYNQYVSDKNFDDHKDFTNQIYSISRTINTIGIILFSIFSAISILIVFNTIKLNIYAHREEIAVMKYVGASNFFITSPYILEAIIYSCISFILSTLIMFFSIDFIQPYIVDYFQGAINLPLYFINNSIIIFGSELGVSILLTILASALAVRKYLKV